MVWEYKSFIVCYDWNPKKKVENFQLLTLVLNEVWFFFHHCCITCDVRTAYEYSYPKHQCIVVPVVWVNFFKFPIFEQFPSSLFLSPATVEEEQIIVNDTYVDDVYRYRFSRYTYDFRNEVNTTFLFYLSDFTHPFTFRVSSLFTFHISLLLQKERNVGFDWLTEWSLALLILCWWHFVFYYGSEKKILWQRKDEKRTKYTHLYRFSLTLTVLSV